MDEDTQPSKVTTESSQAVLKAVAGRLAKIDAGELPTLTYVGPDGTTPHEVSHTGEVKAVPVAVASAGPLKADNERWVPKTAHVAPVKQGFFARLFAKFRRSEP